MTTQTTSSAKSAASKLASGMIAALSAARLVPSLRIAVLERLSRVGKKLMATGNGRCNLTNLNADAANYHGARQAARQALPSVR